MNQQYVGSPISLISKSGIRYEGILDHIDREQGQVHLRNVYALGTEGRRMDGPQIPAQPNMFNFIVFRGSDIASLKVISQFQGPPQQPAMMDPAIVSRDSQMQMQQPQQQAPISFGYVPQSGPTVQPPPLLSSPKTQHRSSSSTASGAAGPKPRRERSGKDVGAAAPPPSSSSAAAVKPATASSNGPTQKMWNIGKNASGGGSGSVAAGGSGNNSGSVGGGDRAKSSGQRQGNSGSRSGQDGKKISSGGKSHGGGGGSGGGGSAQHQHHQHHHHHPQSPSPQGDFDYVQSTSKFDKESLAREVEGDDDATVQSSDKKPVFEDNFYDSLSSDVTTKMDDRGARYGDRKQQASLNVETFGKARVYHNNNSQGGNHHHRSSRSGGGGGSAGGGGNNGSGGGVVSGGGSGSGGGSRPRRQQK